MSFELNHPIIIFVCKDGTVTYERLGKPAFNRVALPVHSVDTVEEAETIQVALCRRQHINHPKTGKAWYTLTNFGGTLEELGDVAAQMQAQSARIKARAVTRAV
jgi:hypothetical protein